MFLLEEFIYLLYMRKYWYWNSYINTTQSRFYICCNLKLTSKILLGKTLQ